MKKLSIFKKLVYFITLLIALLLLLACIIPYFPVKIIPLFSFVSLGVPALVVVNIFFALYWILIRIKKSLLSMLALIIGYIVLGSFVQFRGKEDVSSEDELVVMTYNSYGFQGLDETKEKENGKNIIEFIGKHNPDIICFQEFDHQRIKSGELGAYPYNYVNFKFGAPRNKVIQAIYSKYPLISIGNLDFPNSQNNGLYADILYKKDTLRVYNLHLESLKISAERKLLRKPFGAISKQLRTVFSKQEEQAELISAHTKMIKYKKIICGDFNNNQYSRIYNLIKGGMQDSFEVKGSGYGRTFNYHGLPLRIDFILVDKELKVKSHKNFNVEYSDHFPVMASFSLD